MRQRVYNLPKKLKVGKRYHEHRADLRNKVLDTNFASDEQRAFEPQQEFLRLDASRIPDKFVVASDDTMAGNDDGKRIRPVGPTYGLVRARHADSPR